MALPTIITVTGTLLAIDGTPAKGHVTFQSPVSALDSATDTVAIPSYKVATLSVSGTFSITLPASNDPLWTPVGWSYVVTVRADDARYSFQTVIPYDAPGGEIAFSELLPSVDGGSSLYAAYSHTHAGAGGGSVTWNEITGKPTTFPPSAHTHDDRYFTESEVTTLLSGKEAAGTAASLISGIDYPVDSVAGKTGTVTLTKSDVGLSNVDNTSDANKPVSIATQTALNGKQDAGSYATAGQVTDLDARLDVLEAVTAPVFSWNGSAYVEDEDARIYVGPNDPGSVPDGSIWIEVP